MTERLTIFSRFDDDSDCGTLLPPTPCLLLGQPDVRHRQEGRRDRRTKDTPDVAMCDDVR
jgi:hypothetical protein